MNIVIDANILFSALIKDSKTREIILGYNGYFLFPFYIFIEMKKYKYELLRKSQMNTEDFEKLLQLLLNKVKIVAHEKIAPYKEEAYNLIKHIDPDDTLFIACCLAHNDSVLWSDDKQLKKQDRIRIIDTKDMINLIEKSGT